MRMKPLLWVEGVIGCGKTTFSREVAKRLNFECIEEPVDDNPYLEPFYEDQKTFATMMQMYLLHRRYLLQRQAAGVALGVNSYNGAILDRSLSGDRVFAKVHRDDGNISQLDWETYEMCYCIMCHTLLPPTRLVFLDVQPKTAFDRMKKRNRGAEAGVPLDYLVKLRKGYQELLREAEGGMMPWGHAVKTTTIIWDPMNDMPDWDAVASTVFDACQS